MLHLAAIHFNFAAILSALAHFGHFMHAMGAGAAVSG